MEKKQFIKIMHEGTTYDVNSMEDCANAIIEEYERNEICIGELLAFIEIVGFSAQAVVDIVGTVMNRVEGDVIIHTKEGEAEIRHINISPITPIKVKGKLDKEGNIICSCNNNPNEEGFYPCNENGDLLEPLKENWKNLYVCARCKTIHDLSEEE